MLEVGQFIKRRRSQLRDISCVEFLAGNCEDNIPGMHKCGEDNDQPFWLQAESLRGKVFDSMHLVNKFAPDLQHCPLALLS